MTRKLDAQELFSMQDLVEILSLGETSIRRLIKDGHLCKPHPVVSGAKRWTKADVQLLVAKIQLDLLEKAPKKSPGES